MDLLQSDEESLILAINLIGMLSSLEHIVVVVVLFIAFHRISSQCAATASRTAR